MKFRFLFFVLLLFPRFTNAQFEKYYSDAVGSTSTTGALWIVGIIIVAIFLWGGSSVRVAIRNIAVGLGGLCLYGYVLSKLALFLSVTILGETKDELTWVFFLIFILGWFGPLYLYSKRK